MRRRFILWGVGAVLFLAAAAAVGEVVKETVRPTPYDYRRVFGVTAPGRGPAATTPRPDLQNVTPVAFNPPKPGPDPALLAVIDALSNTNQWNFDTVLDALRMAEELARVGVYVASGTTPTQQSVTADADTLLAALSVRGGGGVAGDNHFAWVNCRVVSVSRTADEKEALVVTRHVTSDGPGGAVQYRRWWLRASAGVTRYGQTFSGWRVYDFDLPGTRLRYTVANGGQLTPNAGTAPGGHFTSGGSITINPGGDDSVTALSAAFAALNEEDRPRAAAALAAADAHRLMPALAAVRTAAAGRLLLLDGRPADALVKFDQALKQFPETPHADLGRAAALNALGRPREALAAVEKFRAAAGEDPLAALELARAKSSDPAAAAEGLRAALKDFPADVRLYAELARVLPPAGRAEAGEVLTNAPDPGAALPKVLRHLAPADPTGDSADAVVAGYRRILPRDPAGMVAGAAGKVRRKDVAAAATQLREGLSGIGDSTRRSVLAAYAEAVARADRVAEGYDAAAKAGRAGEAFRPLLAAAAVPADKAAAGRLRGVVSIHLKDQPADPWGYFYLAKLDRAAGDAAAAEKHLAAGMAKLPAPTRTDRREPPGLPGAAAVRPWEVVAAEETADDRWELFRVARVDALFAQGQWEKAYAEVAPAADTFDDLAGRFAAAGDAAKLAALIARHATAQPDDPDLPAWRVEQDFAAKSYDAACAKAKAFIAAGVGATTEARAKVADRWVRSLVRLNRMDDASEAVTHTLETPGGFLLRALAGAAGNDPKAVEVHLADYTTAGGKLAAVYADPDLGPRLRGPAFDAVRAKYPPPK